MQLENAPEPMDKRPSGSVISVRLEQFLNAYMSILVTLLPNDTSARLVQSANAELSIEVTEFGIEM